MRSLYVAILAVMLGILALSYFVYNSISARFERTYFNPVFDRFDELEIESARSALDSGGRSGLRDYLHKLDRLFGGSHYLLNSSGVDILSRADMSAQIPHPPAVQSRIERQDRVIVTHRSTDGRFWFLAIAPLDRSGPPIYLPYYFLIAAVIVLLYWLAAMGLVVPIRRVSRMADRFGRGELAIRLNLHRKDEIGSLARSFNQMADRIETLITSRTHLLQDISHELRSPLARLKLATKLARTSRDQQTALNRIERDVDRLTVLIGDLVDITRMEGDPSSVNFAPLDLNSLIAAIVSDCRIEADAHRCQLAVSGIVQSAIEGNRELLQRAIENVVRNAIRYSPAGEQINLALTDEPDRVTIAVLDQGPGVEEGLLSDIFEPFFKADPARETSRGSTGLGLSIAKRAIELHHGTIDARNMHPGLAVRIVLPKATIQ
ncbi:MAG TPA: ATP-binding protein [Terriglobales bacterium]|nr:ATP-binding protein [Terriglobales bacterium]